MMETSLNLDFLPRVALLATVLWIGLGFLLASRARERLARTAVLSFAAAAALAGVVALTALRLGDGLPGVPGLSRGPSVLAPSGQLLERLIHLVW